MPTQGYPLISVVEDDYDLRTIYTQLLEHSGFFVNGYSDAQSALAGITDPNGQPPKLIVLDYMLPGANAQQFMQALTGQPNIEKIPVILLSALSAETTEISTLKSHPWVVAFFTKTDIDNNKLVDFIKSYFGLTE